MLNISNDFGYFLLSFGQILLSLQLDEMIQKTEQEYLRSNLPSDLSQAEVMLEQHKRKKLDRSSGKALKFNPDDSKGKKEIFRLVSSNLVPVENSKYGQFYSDECYIIKYSQG